MARILVVDDQEVARRSLEILLASFGHEVVSVSSGIQAISALSDSRKFDLLITDYFMPECDGLDLIVAVRRHSFKTGSIPIILASGALPREIPKGIFFVEKPFDEINLKRVVERALRGEKPRDLPQSFSL